MKIVGGPASRELARKVAETAGLPLIEAEFKAFPDTESYVRFNGDVSDSEVAIVQTSGPPQDVRLLQLFMLIDGARDLGAKRVTAVVPYLAYARQDKRFRPGEVVSAFTILKAIRSMGAHRLITVNIHSPRILEGACIETENLSATTLVAEHAKRLNLDGAFALSPDAGALDIVKEADAVLKGGYGCLEKSRDRMTGNIQMGDREFGVQGRDAIVFDDIISTGGTTAKAVEILKRQGAHRVYAACIHPLMIGNAEKRIADSGCEGIIGTDSIPSVYSVVSIAPIVAKALM